MTKQLRDLFKSFTAMTIEEQYAKINEVRDTRSIERPAVAKRRRKKESVKGERDREKAKTLILNMSEEEREAMIEKLRGEME